MCYGGPHSKLAYIRILGSGDPNPHMQTKARWSIVFHSSQLPDKLVDLSLLVDQDNHSHKTSTVNLGAIDIA